MPLASGARVAEMSPALTWLATSCAAVAIAILLWFLIRKPRLGPRIRTLLLFGLGVFPILSAFTGNVATFEHTASRAFCSSCHVMAPWTDDSNDPHSMTLPAIHARSPRFGQDNCYNCHADYGMFGTMITKLGGLGHVYYYVTEYHAYTTEEALERIEIAEPFSNDACRDCHSTETPRWERVGAHRGLADEARSGEASCMSAGCHGPAHPFSKPGGMEAWLEEMQAPEVPPALAAPVRRPRPSADEEAPR